MKQNSGNIYLYVHGARVSGNKNKGMKTLLMPNFVYIIFDKFQN